MKFSSNRFGASPLLSTILGFLSILPQITSAERVLESRSLQTCMENSQFSATLLIVNLAADNGTLFVNVMGVSSLNTHIVAVAQVIAYGYTAIEQTIDPCSPSVNLPGLCPMTEGPLEMRSNVNELGPDLIKQIPPIAFTVPDIDVKVRIWIREKSTKKNLACVETPLSNRKTVDQKAVGWTTAMISGMGLVASAVTSGFGHSTTAAHVASNAISLFGFMQTQSMFGMSAVPLPPIVAAWTQNFDWSMGIIHINFVQRVLGWYLRATGGEVSHLLLNTDKLSIHITKKREVEQIPRNMLYAREMSQLSKRSNKDNYLGTERAVVKLSGIKRVSFRSKIEITNFFMTGMSFFVAFVVFVALGVAGFKWFSELAIRMKWIRGSKFQEFRLSWLNVLKGIMYRIVLIGFPQMMTLSLWEFTRNDSAGAMTLAVFFFITMSAVLGWGAFRVMMIAKRSIKLHQSPTYTLYSDPSNLNRWGFLYVQFRGDAYYFIAPFLIYVMTKALFIAVGQGIPNGQAIALLLIEFAYLVAVFKTKPWMDKRTNIFNLSIQSINFFNAIFLLIFTSVFKQPGIVTGVMGVIFFVVNASFALVLLILVLISSCYAIFSKDPERRFKPMVDDRTSFIKSGAGASSTELDALGVAARGESKSLRDLDEDASFSSPPIAKLQTEASGTHLPPSTAGSDRYNGPPSPHDPSAFFPSSRQDNTDYRGEDNYYNRPHQAVATNMPLLTAGGQPRAPSRGSDRSASPAPGYQGYNQRQNSPPRQPRQQYAPQQQYQQQQGGYGGYGQQQQQGGYYPQQQQQQQQGGYNQGYY